MRKIVATVLFASIGMGGCAADGGSVPTPSHDNLDAVVWVQSSTEYAAATRSLYSAATQQLELIAASRTDEDRPMAVVLDVDETVLDNANYQGQLIFDDATYESASWDRWIAQQSASAVPGVVEFLTAAQSLGVQVVLVTNRPCRARDGVIERCPQHAETLANVSSLGMDAESMLLYLRGDRPSEQCAPFLTEAEAEDGLWSSDKTSRRACVDRDYEIVMLFGDQLGDFIEFHDTSGGRVTAADFAPKWGSAWFLLPNPTYGGWRPRTTAEKRESLRGTD